MTPANDDSAPAVALQDTPKLPAVPQPLYSLCLSPEDASPPTAPSSAIGLGVLQVPQGSARLEQGVIWSRTRGLSLAAWHPTPAQCCGSGAMPFPHSPEDKMCFCTELCALDLLQALQCHTPRDVPVLVVASGARGVVEASGAALAPQTWLSPCSRLCSWLRGSFPGLLSTKDSAQWEKGPSEGLRRGKCL